VYVCHEGSGLQSTLVLNNASLRGAFFEDKGGICVGGMTSESWVERIPCDEAQTRGGAEVHEQLAVTERLFDCAFAVVRGLGKPTLKDLGSSLPRLRPLRRI
jgi:hypothetical protein